MTSWLAGDSALMALLGGFLAAAVRVASPLLLAALGETVPNAEEYSIWRSKEPCSRAHLPPLSAHARVGHGPGFSRPY